MREPIFPLHSFLSKPWEKCCCVALGCSSSLSSWFSISNPSTSCTHLRNGLHHLLPHLEGIPLIPFVKKSTTREAPFSLLEVFSSIWLVFYFRVWIWGFCLGCWFLAWEVFSGLDLLSIGPKASGWIDSLISNYMLCLCLILHLWIDLPKPCFISWFSLTLKCILNAFYYLVNLWKMGYRLALFYMDFHNFLLLWIELMEGECWVNALEIRMMDVKRRGWKIWLMKWRSLELKLLQGRSNVKWKLMGERKDLKLHLLWNFWNWRLAAGCLAANRIRFGHFSWELHFSSDWAVSQRLTAEPLGG